MTSGFSDPVTLPTPPQNLVILILGLLESLGEEHLKAPLSETDQVLSVRGTEREILSESVLRLDSTNFAANSVSSLVVHVASVSSFANGIKPSKSWSLHKRSEDS